MLNRNGWRVDYFGASTPIDELVRAVGRSRPELVVVAATTTDRFTAILGELAQLAAVAPLALAGAGATQHMADGSGPVCSPATPSPPPSTKRGPARGGLVSVSSTGRPTVLWFRRDLRLDDHPALVAAARQGPVVPLFVLDDVLLRTAGRPRLAYLLRTLRALDAQLAANGRRAHASVGAIRRRGPVGGRRDRCGRRPHLRRLRPVRRRNATERVVAALGEVPLVATGSPYAVAPDRIRKPNGDPYQVFAPFYRSWVANGWDAPARFDRRAVEWLTIAGEAIPDDPTITATLPDAGETAATRSVGTVPRRWTGGLRRPPRPPSPRRHLAHVAVPQTRRDPPTHAASRSRTGRRRLSPPTGMAGVLRHGAPPRAVHARGTPSSRTWRAWTTTVVPPPISRFDAWAAGRTGYPLVDAGMRQLLEQGWMHNRVRMITASFLVKDLHIDWTRGARHFMDHLIDGDLASNQHGWQWTAGTGTDAGAVLPDLQPGQPEPQVRSRRRLHPPLGAGAGGVAQHRDPRPVAPTARCSIGVPRTDRRPRRRAGRRPRSLSPRALSARVRRDRTVFLALKEMRRAWVRFGLLIAAIGLLVFLILFQQALQSGLVTSFVGAIRNQSAPVLVYSVDGQRVLQGSVITPELEQVVRATPDIADIGYIGQGTFTVIAADEPADAAIIGYEREGLGSPPLPDGGSAPRATGRGSRQRGRRR